MVGKLLGIRLPDNIMNKLEMIAQQRNETSNQLGKKAVIEWIEVLFASRNLNMIIFSKNSLVKMISYLTEQQLDEIAIEVGYNINEYFQFLMKTHQTHISDEMFYEIVTRFLGPAGCMWFEHLEFDLGNNKQKAFFNGTHKSGKNWSIFAKKVIEVVLKKNYNYKIFPESIQLGENVLYFQFSL